MKNLLGLLFLGAIGLPFACSSSEGKFNAIGNGGTTSIGGSSSTGGSGGSAVNTTEGLHKDWSTDGGADAGYVGSDGPFGNILEHPYGDPNDPCTLAAIWITGVTLDIANGDLVQYQGKVYKYDTSTSSCNKTITYTFDACLPSAPADWCKPCWILQDTVCPIIDITVIPDVASDAGTDAG